MARASRTRHIPRPSMLETSLLLTLATGMALAMLVPAVHALALGDEATARAFGWSGLLLATLCVMTALALSGMRQRRAPSPLLSLPGAFAVLPLMLAVPFAEATGAPYLTAYVEMVSSLTTTGLSYLDPALLPAPVHLWRSMVAWSGGLLVWVAAAAILAPMNLAGFEIGAIGDSSASAGRAERMGTAAEAADRVARVTKDLAPIYTGLTFVMWLLLLAAGDRPFVALCHAMATLSTSGVSPIGGVSEARSGVFGEAAIALFLVLALSRATFLPGGTHGLRRAARDAELRLATALILGATTLLFLRHWVGAIDRGGPEDPWAALAALWGSFFTVMGFLTTAGFESVHWDEARAWSGLEAAGPILLALAVIGGGVATTAGGIKLFRVYALVKHGVRELERLSHPSSVGGSGRRARRIRREGARLAFVFAMLFAIALALVTLALAGTGIDLENAMTLAAAALANAGPLAAAAPAEPLPPPEIGPLARLVLSAAMVLGRLEMLAVVALLSPGVWRG